MKRFATEVVAIGLLWVAPHADAQWMKVPNATVPRTRAGEANLTAPAPKMRTGQPDLSGVWAADGAPVPKGILTIEGDEPFPPHMINVAADLPPDGVPFQPWAAALFGRRASGNSQADDPTAHCKPSGLPLLDTGPLPFKILATPGIVVVLYEENTVFRQIFLDRRKTVDDPVPRAMGYSTGRWDGDALVVETVGFSDRHWLDALGHPLTEKLHLTERFRRRDAGHLEIEVTIDDPGAYTKPFSYTIKATLVPDDDLLEYFCTDNEKDAQHYQ